MRNCESWAPNGRIAAIKPASYGLTSIRNGATNMAQRLDNATSLYLEAIRDGDYVEAINEYAGAR